MNFCIILGTVSRPPRFFSTPGKTPFLIVPITYEDQVGDKRYPKYADCVSYLKTAEQLSKSIKQGDLVVCKGRAESSIWENKEGEKKSQLKVVGEIAVLMPCGDHSPASALPVAPVVAPAGEDEAEFRVPF